MIYGLFIQFYYIWMKNYLKKFIDYMLVIYHSDTVHIY